MYLVVPTATATATTATTTATITNTNGSSSSTTTEVPVDMLRNVLAYVCQYESRLLSYLQNVDGKITQLIIELVELFIRFITPCDARDNVRWIYLFQWFNCVHGISKHIFIQLQAQLTHLQQQQQQQQQQQISGADGVKGNNKWHGLMYVFRKFC